MNRSDFTLIWFISILGFVYMILTRADVFLLGLALGAAVISFIAAFAHKGDK